MKCIVATIKPGDSGANVANLAQSLLRLIDRSLLKTYVESNHPTADELVELVLAMK